MKNASIVTNTLMLYIRMIILMGVSLYTTRIILESLGITDYGIYNIVGGIVSLLSIVTTSQAGAINRFIAFAIGEKTENGANEAFSAGIIVQFILGFLVLILGESIGLCILNSYLDIPGNRLFAANIVFQLSLLTFVINMISVPYNAAIIATEQMSIFALIGLFEGLALLISAIIVKNSGFDKLIIYATLVFFVSIIIRTFYVQFCRRTIRFCHYTKTNKRICMRILSFGGWNMIGVMSGILKEQGIALLFNLFFGPSLNAAKGISTQVGTAVTKFSENFLTAVRPRVTKSVAANEVNYRNNLVFLSSKWAFFLLLIISFPLLINTHSMMHVWLKEVPLYAVSLTRLCLIQSLIDVISIPIVMLILAHGNIKNYQIWVGGVQLLNIPAALTMILVYNNPIVAAYCSCCISLLCVFLRLFMAKKLVNFPIMNFAKATMIKCILVSFSCCTIQLIMWEKTSFQNQPLLLRMIFSALIVIISIAIMGVSKKEWAVGITYINRL